MSTRNVVLTDHQASLVGHLVASGRHQNASEVLREGLRLVKQREAEDAYRLEALRSAVQVGIDDISAGKFKAFERKESPRTHLKSITDKAIAAFLGSDGSVRRLHTDKKCSIRSRQSHPNPFAVLYAEADTPSSVIMAEIPVPS